MVVDFSCILKELLPLGVGWGGLDEKKSPDFRFPEVGISELFVSKVVKVLSFYV